MTMGKARFLALVFVAAMAANMAWAQEYSTSLASKSADQPPVLNALVDAPEPFLVPSAPTFKRPAPKPVIDRKFLAMSVAAMALTVADIERTQHCLGTGTCVELNPTLPHSRAGMYAANLPVNLAAIYLSYRLKAAGRRTWWIAPLVVGGVHGVGASFRF